MTSLEKIANESSDSQQGKFGGKMACFTSGLDSRRTEDDISD